MFRSAITATRRAAPSHQPWQPHDYQRRAVQFLIERGAAALFLDPGLGKTSIVLEAFSWLKRQGIAKRMLVVAPLRVCQTVWRQEGQKWTQFRDLRFSLLHGAKKDERLRDDADVWLINPEGVAWLCKPYLGRSLPFDTVVLDELTKFKNHGAERSKLLRPRLKGVARRYGLTGTPAPNGYADLFGQMLMLDDGAALGRYVTHFRDQYFQVDYNGFDYKLLPGAEKRIETKIAPYVLRMSADEYLSLPPVVDDVRELDMDTASRKTYDKMRKEMLAELPEGVVTGANAAAAYSKCKQMANGAVYVNGDTGQKSSVAHIHDIKLEALDDLVEELAGQQLLIAYEFQHDLDRLQKHFGDKLTAIESGQSAARINEIVEAWNAGTLPLLAAHPQSAAHGLNMQHSGCGHLCWFGPIWDLELYQQFIGRVCRQGNEAQRIVNHILCVKDTIDELALAALRDKDTTQSRLLISLSSVLTGEKETKDMSVAKLSRPAAVTADSATRPVPKGWGRPAAANDQPSDLEAQRERIREKLGQAPAGAPQEQGESSAGVKVPAQEVIEPTPAERARAAFGGTIAAKRAEIEGDRVETRVMPAQEQLAAAQEKGDPKPTRQRAKPSDVKIVANGESPFRATVGQKLEAFNRVVNRFKFASVSDAIEATRELVEFLDAV